MNDSHILDVLTREGVLLNVSVRYWRATKKLKPEDLGLNPDNVSNRLISLGHKKLLPKDRLKEFARIESRAHALVYHPVENRSLSQSAQKRLSHGRSTTQKPRPTGSVPGDRHGGGVAHLLSDASQPPRAAPTL